MSNLKINTRKELIRVGEILKQEVPLVAVEYNVMHLLTFEELQGCMAFTRPYQDSVFSELLARSKTFDQAYLIAKSLGVKHRMKAVFLNRCLELCISVDEAGQLCSICSKKYLKEKIATIKIACGLSKDKEEFFDFVVKNIVF